MHWSPCHVLPILERPLRADSFVQSIALLGGSPRRSAPQEQILTAAAFYVSDHPIQQDGSCLKRTSRRSGALHDFRPSRIAVIALRALGSQRVGIAPWQRRSSVTMQMAFRPARYDPKSQLCRRLYLVENILIPAVDVKRLLTRKPGSDDYPTGALRRTEAAIRTPNRPDTDRYEHGLAQHRCDAKPYASDDGAT
jgi:hypothetical protein